MIASVSLIISLCSLAFGGLFFFFFLGAWGLARAEVE